MVGLTLITTALEETWPDKKQPVLFLGEWCRLYSRKNAWSDMNGVVAPYHWNDRNKLQQDYLYLKTLHEELLHELSTRLNEIHNVDYSVRYWRILVGPWLGYFVQMLFDRWSMLKCALDNNNISSVRVLCRRQGELVPNDMSEFDTYLTSQQWNEYIYGEILKYLGVSVELVSPQHNLIGISNQDYHFPIMGSLKHGLINLINFINRVLSRDKDFFFISSYLGFFNEFILQARLGQIPKLWRMNAPPKVAFETEKRNWNITGDIDVPEFEGLARTLIPKHIPVSYLEGYETIKNVAMNLPWPKAPKAIFTSNSYSSDDVFKLWAAEKTECGTPLVIGQHGGNYGMGLWSFTEDHQIAIADLFLSWGWKDARNFKVIPVGNFKNQGKKINRNKLGNALLVQMSMPQYSYTMYCVPVAAEQWQSYFEDLSCFIAALPMELRSQVMVRLYSNDYGNSQAQRWSDQFPDLKLEGGKQQMSQLMNKARIYIGTYNATTYLESLSINFPTIIFWNPDHWELREEAKPYFEKLKSVGIFHESPQGAAEQMTRVWNDVDAWWESEQVQSAINMFCKYYADTKIQSLGVIESVMRKG